MKSNKLIIAAAGSGKTTFLVNKALIQNNEKVLITTYTQANELEIRKKFIELNGCIPSNVVVQTWFSTLLQHGVRPFQGGVYEETVRGMVLVNERSGVKYVDKKNAKKYYYGESDIKNYYFTKTTKIYSDKISKFVLRCNESSNGAVLNRLSQIFPHIYIDEIQDLAGYDLEILKLLMMSKSNTLFVGDPRQVTYHTHHSSKYKKYKEGRIKEFIQNECGKISCEIDEDSLNKSRRSNQVICDYSSRLYPEFRSSISIQSETTDHDGVFLVKKDDVRHYLEKYNPVQLRDKVTVEVNNDFKSINFGESKGQTFNRVLIYPTKGFVDWISENNSKLAPTSRSKLYVALTRAKYSVGIVYNYDERTNFEGIKKYVVES